MSEYGGKVVDRLEEEVVDRLEEEEERGREEEEAERGRERWCCAAGGCATGGSAEPEC